MPLSPAVIGALALHLCLPGDDADARSAGCIAALDDQALRGTVADPRAAIRVRARAEGAAREGLDRGRAIDDGAGLAADKLLAEFQLDAARDTPVAAAPVVYRERAVSGPEGTATIDTVYRTGGAR